MNRTRQIELSIIIKTLNEERNIARCIEAILGSLDDIPIEIIVADSGSNDRTVEIASGYPVTVVQLADPTERSCGIGPQLGYQHSHGRYILILDADMVLHAPFVRSALARMEAEPRCGGIGGQLVECSGTGYEYELQLKLNAVHEDNVRWLNGCAIYRREAIASVGYLSNRNLHAYEEKELGLRLTHAGWTLCRFAEVAVDHYGYTTRTLPLLWRRWYSGYADACGESIRACIGKPYLIEMLLVHKVQLLSLLIQFTFLASFAALPWHPAFFFSAVALGAIGLLVQMARKGGIIGATNSFLYTNVFAVGLIRGLFRSHRNPEIPIRSIVLKETVG